MTITFRLGTDGLAHACPAGWATALCGTQGRATVTAGTPCPRCLTLAADRLADEPA